MATKENIIVSVATEFDGKALAKGQKQLSSFEKSASQFGKIFAGAFSAQKIVEFGKSSVNAFIESEKAGKSLNQTLLNLGMAYKSPAIDSFLNKLSLQVGIVDEELKPAYNQLLLATRDTEQAQSLLNTALDVSAGTGKDLQSVTAALSKAYVGNTTALQNLGIGLSKAQLTGASFASLQKELNFLFAGQASTAASGYTGEIAKLNVAYDQLKEAVGKGLLQGLNADGNIDKTTQSLSNLSEIVGKLAYGLAFLSTVGKSHLFSKDFWRGLVSDPTVAEPGVAGAGSDRGGAAKSDDERRAKLAALQARTATLQTTAAKAQSAAARAQLLLTKAGSVLDVQQAEIYAALQGKITEQEKLRLDLQLALLTKNEDAAYALSQQLLVSQLKTTDLASTIANLPKALNPFADWPKYIQDLIAQMAQLKAAIPGAPTVTPTTTQNPYDAMFEKLKQQNIAMGIEPGAAAGLAASSSRLQAEADAYFKAHPEIDPMTGAIRSGFAGSAQATGASYTFNIDANNTIDPNSITKAVQDAILIINRNGYSTVPAGQGF